MTLGSGYACLRRPAAAIGACLCAAACGVSPAKPTAPLDVPTALVGPASGFGSVTFGAVRQVPDLAQCLRSAGAECFSPVRLAASLVAAATAPGAPGGLIASAVGSLVTLTWSAPASGDPVRSYVLEAGSSVGSANLANFSTGGTATSFSAPGVASGTYFVRVRAMNDGGTSPPSNESTLIVGGGPCMAPGPPGGLTIVSNSGGSVVLAWSPGSGTSTSFLVEAGSVSGQSNLANSDIGAGTTMTATGVPAGTYYVRVRARNACGTSAASTEIVLTVSLATDPAPVLSVAIVDLGGAYDPTTKRLGALNCTFTFGTDANDRWCFNAFGSRAVPGKQGVSYDYKVAAGAAVFAAAPGTVFRVDAETNALYPNEFEVETRSAPDGSYSVIYDHVKNLTVGVGLVVQPGMVLGSAGIHTTNPSIWGRVELQINRITQRTPTIRSVSLCPRAFGTERFNQLNDAALAAHNSANAPFAAASVCLVDTIGPF